MKWNTPSTDIVLLEKEVHIWRVCLPISIVQESTFWNVLSPEEKKRIHRYQFEHDRNRHLLSRGMLRYLLGHYLNVALEALVFKYSQYGKPSLESPYCKTGLQFNVSHSHNLILLAFCWNHPLGVDIEYMRPLTNADQIAQKYFSSREYAIYLSVSSRHRREAFYNCWTRKEAFIKAIGEGLSYPLDAFDVTVHPDKPAKILQVQGDTTRAKLWTLNAFNPDSGYKAAAVVIGQSWKFLYWKEPLIEE